MERSSLCLVYAVLAASALSRTWCFQVCLYRGTKWNGSPGRFHFAEQAQRHRKSFISLRMFSSDDVDNYTEEDFDELSDEELEATVGKWDEKIARFNSIQLTGRVGNTPEARYFDDGKVVVNLSLATQRKYHVMDRKMNNIKPGDEETDWYGLEVWGQTAEFVAKYVDKGARIGVVGQLQIDSWTDKASGEERNRAKVIVRDLDILESRAEAELRRNGRRASYSDEDDYEDGPMSAGTGGFFNDR